MVFSSSDRALPSIDGSVPLGSVIDFHLQHNPNHTWAVLADANGGSPTSVTYEQFGHAIHRAAHILNPGALLPQGTKLGILISTDTIIYLALTFGAMRAGLVPFPLSPRTQVAGISHLLNSTQTSRILAGGSRVIEELWDKIQSLPENENRSFEITRIPTPAELFPSLVRTNIKLRPFSRFPNLGPTRDNTLVAIMHSSGSTGLPRALEVNHGSAFANLVHPPACWELGGPGDHIGLMVLPPFHMMGFTWHGVMPLYVGYAPVFFGLSQNPVVPTAESTLQAMIATNCKALMSVPTFLEAWSKDPNAMSHLKKLRGLYYGGGALADWIGNSLVANGVPLQSAYGATEIGCINKLRPLNPLRTPEDWAYLEFTDLATPRLVPQNDEDGTYELVILATEQHKPLILNTEIDGRAAYATKDLLLPHPTKPGLWKTVGRLDDQIVLANGEKINPEDVMTTCPHVQLTAMFGRERNQTGVLLELTPGAQSDYQSDQSRIIKEIWPFIEKANGFGPSHARLIKEVMIFADPKRPLQRTPKGTLARAATLKAYSKEIDGMYAALERGDSGTKSSEIPSSWKNREDVEKWMQSCVEEILGSKIDIQGDLFHQGLDSLTASILMRTILNAFSSSTNNNNRKLANQITQETIFKHPSVSQMSNLLVGLSTGGGNPQLGNSKDIAITSIRRMIEKYDYAATSKVSLAPRLPSNERVLLTGSTGGLGSHLLAQLLANDRVERIWALNRRSGVAGKSLQQRQLDAFEDKRLDTNLLNSPKLVLLESDLSSEKIGLPGDLYEEITNTSSLFIHNAWQVNFNLSLQSFESSIRFTRQLIDLALAAKNQPRFLFTSSVSAAGFATPGRRLKETAVDISDAATSIGYGQSKFVVEKILESARQGGLEAAIIRLGQLSGDSSAGAWPLSDWVPSAIASSVTAGCLANAIGIISWAPLDIIAKSIVEISQRRDEVLPLFIHCAHPRPIDWSQAMGMFLEEIASQTGRRLSVVSFPEWNARVNGLILGSKDSPDVLFKLVPTAKIQSRIEEMVRADDYITKHAGEMKEAEVDGTARLGTTEGERLSPSLKELKCLTRDDVRKWVGYWKARGLFVLD